MEKADFSEVKKSELTRAEVIDALNKAKEAGIPEPMSTTDPKALEIQKIVGDYSTRIENEAENTGKPSAILLARLETTPLIFDGGYDDEYSYVDEVIDWLMNDLALGESYLETTTDGEEKKKIQEAVDKIKAKIDELSKKRTELAYEYNV